ncbi:MAG TPA: polysaccharide biosynthesis/export family protein [Steroidobacteraceae bacterium]
MTSQRVLIALVLATLAGAVWADEHQGGIQPAGAALPGYHLQPGDIITVSVWKETDLQAEVLVRPDGGFTFPLAGEVAAMGRTVDDIRTVLVDRLKRYIPNPVVTVALKQINGNRIYVVGRVNHAGDFPLSSPLDVMQAIALAGGTTPFAAINDIVILRRQNGQQQAIHFHYADVARGRDLAQNVLLQTGDTVVVP